MLTQVFLPSMLRSRFERCNVSVGSVDDYGYQIINYSVLDEFENKVIDQRLVRHYESPVVLSSNDRKYSQRPELEMG